MINKKKYQTPAATVIDVEVENQLLAGSNTLGISDNQEDNINDPSQADASGMLFVRDDDSGDETWGNTWK